MKDILWRGCRLHTSQAALRGVRLMSEYSRTRMGEQRMFEKFMKPANKKSKLFLNLTRKYCQLKNK